MNQENLLNKIRQKDAKAFTHGGKFHADDIFSSALLLYLNPEIQITRGNQVPEEYDGIVFDIGRGAYDHHQKDSRIRENSVPTVENRHRKPSGPVAVDRLTAEISAPTAESRERKNRGQIPDTSCKIDVLMVESFK